METIFGATLYLVDSVEAVRVYCQAFGAGVGYHVFHDNGTYLHAELHRGAYGLFAVSESDDEGARAAQLAVRQPTVSLGVALEDEPALRHCVAVLAEGGRILRPLGPLPWSPLSADLVDRFGVCWYLYVSQHRPDSLGDAGRG